MDGKTRDHAKLVGKQLVNDGLKELGDSYHNDTHLFLLSWWFNKRSRSSGTPQHWRKCKLQWYQYWDSGRRRLVDHRLQGTSWRGNCQEPRWRRWRLGWGWSCLGRIGRGIGCRRWSFPIHMLWEKSEIKKKKRILVRFYDRRTTTYRYPVERHWMRPGLPMLGW